MQERTLEIVGLECTTHLEEAISLVAVGQIGRRDNHVFNLLSKGG